jgi:small subunit ribosomal protein S20
MNIITILDTSAASGNKKARRGQTESYKHITEEHELANHKSAIKRHKQSEKRRLRNTAVKSTIKTAVKKVRVAADSGNKDEAADNLKTAAKLLDKAVTKGVLHRNNASRRISRLTTLVNGTESK